MDFEKALMDQIREVHAEMKAVGVRFEAKSDDFMDDAIVQDESNLKLVDLYGEFMANRGSRQVVMGVLEECEDHDEISSCNLGLVELDAKRIRILSDLEAAGGDVSVLRGI